MKRRWALERYLANRVDALWLAYVECACTCDRASTDPADHKSDCYVRMALHERRRDERACAKVRAL